MGLLLFTSLMLFGIASGVPKSTLPETVVVNIKGQGQIRGNYDSTAWTKQRIMQFRGVHYAESPSGSLRFKASIERFPWNNVLDATQWGRRCPEYTIIERLNATELQQDLEDCLHLCVYTKNLSRKSPVMVYIHGGSFINGTSIEHTPNYLMEKDIVLVVPQYRLGLLGFMSTGTDDIPGNAALADCLLALEWIQRHIADFGGDPENVTIFGQSAGAAIINVLLISPKTPENLFHRAILQSGSMFSTTWSTVDKPLDQAKRVCNMLGCMGCQTDVGLNACFMKASVPSLLNASKNEWISPVLADKLGILPEKPQVLVKQMKRSVPIMTGFTKHDGSFVLAEYYDRIVQAYQNQTLTVREFIEGAFSNKEGSEVILQKRLFFNRTILDSTDHAKALPAYFDMCSFEYFKSPALTLAANFLKRNLSNIYFYTFDYQGEHTSFGYGKDTSHYPFNGGVHHSDDNIYIFLKFPLNSRDAKVSMKMIDYWTSFAMTGAPYSEQDFNMKIKQMECENGPYFHINEKTTTGYDVYDELTAAINDLESNKLQRNRKSFL